MITHPNRPTNPAAHGRESNSQPVDHMSDALITTLPSHHYCLLLWLVAGVAMQRLF